MSSSKKHTIEIVSKPEYILPLEPELSAIFDEFHHQFIELYETNGKNVLSHLQKRVTEGLHNTRIRSIYWRIFLGYFPHESLPNEWNEIAAKHRSNYIELLTNSWALSKHASANQGSEGDGKSSNEAEDLLRHNPLSTRQDSVWKQYYEDKELCDMIHLDLIRTNCDQEFYAAPVVQQQMLNILFVWCKQNPEYSYRQGMNDLISVILLVLAMESVNVSDADQDGGKKVETNVNVASSSSASASSSSSSSSSLDTTTMQEGSEKETKIESNNSSDNNTIAIHLLNRKYVEHDAYVLFSLVMEYMAPFFGTQPQSKTNTTKATGTSSSSSASSSATSHLPQVRISGQHHNPTTLLGTSPIDSPSPAASPTREDPPLVKRINRIFYDLLPIYDMQLFQHLQSNDVLPTVFLLKWVRLLFSREFKFRDTCMVWDVLFAFSERTSTLSLSTDIAPTATTPAKSTIILPLVEPMCIAMLVFIRETLLEGDNSHCLRRLMRYPPVEHLPSLLSKAADLAKNKAPIAFPKPILVSKTQPIVLQRSNSNPKQQKSTHASVTKGNSGSGKSSDSLDAVGRFFSKITNKISDALSSHGDSNSSHSRSSPNNINNTKNVAASASQFATPKVHSVPHNATAAAMAGLQIERLEARVTRLEAALAAASHALGNAIDGIQTEWEAGMGAETTTRSSMSSSNDNHDLQVNDSIEQKETNEGALGQHEGQHQQQQQQQFEEEISFRPMSSKALLDVLTTLSAIKDECDRLKPMESKPTSPVVATSITTESAVAVATPTTTTTTTNSAANSQIANTPSSNTPTSASTTIRKEPIFFAPQNKTTNTYWQEEPVIFTSSLNNDHDNKSKISIGTSFFMDLDDDDDNDANDAGRGKGVNAESATPSTTSVQKAGTGINTTTAIATTTTIEDLTQVKSVFDKSVVSKDLPSKLELDDKDHQKQSSVSTKSATLSAKSQAALKELFGEDDPLASFAIPVRPSGEDAFDSLFD